MIRPTKRSAIIGWWLIAFMACCIQLIRSPESSVFLLEPATNYSDPAAAETTWNIPLVSQSMFDQGVAISEWLAAAMAAGLIVSVLNRFSSGGRLGNVICVVLLASVWSPHHLLAWFWLLIAIRCLPQESRWNWKTTLLMTASSTAAILTTLDFTIVIILVITAALDSIIQQRKMASASPKPQLACICVIGAMCLLLSFSFSGFSQALLRPLSAVSMTFAATPYASLQTVDHSLLDSIILAMSMLVVLDRLRHRQNSNLMPMVTTVVFLVAGMLCREYVAFAVVVLLRISAVQKTEGTAKDRASFAAFTNTVAVVGISAIAVLQIYQLKPLLSSDPLRQRLVDFSSLNSAVTVLLTNPDSTSRWKSHTSPPNSTLIVDDRWERFTTEVAEETQQVFADLLRGRREHYILANTKTGGTRDWMRDIKPDLLVVDSDQWTAIRQLSLDPNWNVIAIDGHQTVFAASSRPELNMRAQEASRLWFFLEWPNPRSQVMVEGILEPGLEADSIRIAGVLNAMRLPYAALRVLPQDDSVECQFQQAWSYTELAIRGARQNGQTSLLDVFRAAILLHHLKYKTLQSPMFKKHVSRLQNALEQAIDLNLAPAAGTEKNADLQSNVLSLIAGGKVEKAIAMNPMNGIDHRSETVVLMLRGLESGDKKWTAAVQEIATSDDCPNDLRIEILYYLGCLALENREIELAIQYFYQAVNSTDSNHTEPPISLTLCRLYLMKLSQ